MGMPKGQSGNPKGKPKGIQNKTTIEFKEAINKLLTHAAPSMVKWLDRIAEEDPYKALSIIDKLGEFAYPKLSRVTTAGDPEAPLEHKVRVELIASNHTDS